MTTFVYRQSVYLVCWAPWILTSTKKYRLGAKKQKQGQPSVNQLIQKLIIMKQLVSELHWLNVNFLRTMFLVIQAVGKICW